MTDPSMSQAETVARFRARLFGPFKFEGVHGDGPVSLGRKTRALLAYLVLAGPDPTPREKLCGLFWSDRREEQARGSLRYALHELRTLTLGDGTLLKINRMDVRVDFDRIETDLDRLRALSDGSDAEALAALLGEKPAELLSDLDNIDSGFDDWLAGERIRRQEERHATATTVARRARAAGSTRAAYVVATRLLAAEPFDEIATQIAMEARSALGDRDGVRRIFGRYAAALRREVDARPPPEMVALRDKLTAGSADLTDDPDSQTGGSPPSEADAPQARPPPPDPRVAPGLRAGRGLAIVAMLAIVLVVAAGGLYLRMGALHARARAVPQVGRVEVTRFEPQQADPELRRLSAGLADALARRLAATGVETAEPPSDARSASVDPAESTIAGSVDRDGDKYVVSSRILDRRTGRILWSGRIERPTATATAFPEQVASRVADVINCGQRHRLAAHTAMEPAVFSLVLGTCAARRGDPSQMLETARRLVEAAPNLSIAHAILGVAAARVAMETASPTDAAALQSTARASAHRALDLDPADSEAYFAIALSYGERAHWLEREQNLQRALRLDPDFAPPRNIYVDLLREVGRLDEAADLAAASVAADPFSAAELHKLIIFDAARGDSQNARSLIEQLALIDPEFAREARWTLAFWSADTAAARSAVRALAPAQDRACFDGYLARLARAGAAGVRGLPAACARVDPNWRMRMLARQGDLDGAYSEIPRASTASPITTIAFFYPEMKAFREDPRFMPLATRLGLTDYWRRSQHWPDFCREPDLPYKCTMNTAGT